MHDVVDESVTRLQRRRDDAEGRVPAESIALFDATVHSPRAKLQALDDRPGCADSALAADGRLIDRIRS